MQCTEQKATLLSYIKLYSNVHLDPSDPRSPAISKCPERISNLPFTDIWRMAGVAELYRMPQRQAVVLLSGGTVGFLPNPDH